VAVKPNFFIVGAPKCGTTALYEYLQPHPRIFLSRIKEPHYFARDLGSYPRIKTAQEYAGIFAESTSEHLALGEASVYYLRSAVAIPLIREFNPAARLIAMFRNPVDMVYSLHSQLLYVSEETVGTSSLPGGCRSAGVEAWICPPEFARRCSSNIVRWDSSERRRNACSSRFRGIRSS
jgi:hypothetical protein